MQTIGKLSAVYRCETTYNGWTLDVAKSALQKYVRRGVLPKALFALFEMDLFAFLRDPRSEGIRSNMIHRLMVMYMEDIGVANADIWPAISSDIFAALEARERRRGWQDIADDAFKIQRNIEVEALVRVVYTMCRSVHGRECSYYRYAFVTYPSLKKPGLLPDVDLEIAKRFRATVRYTGLNTESSDVINAAMQFLGALEANSPACLYWGNCISELKTQKHMGSTKPAFLIFNLIKSYLAQKVLDEGRRLYLTERVDVAIKWFKELSPLKEDFLCWFLPCLLIIRLNTTGITPNTVQPTDVKKLLPIIRRNILSRDIELDDYVLDMHTKTGRRMGKDSEFFATVSSVVENEDPKVYQPYKDAYLKSKMTVVEDAVQQPSEAVPSPASLPPTPQAPATVTDVQEEPEWPQEEKDLDFVVRAQLVTSNHHTDTFFVRFGGQLLFVKGPFISMDVPTVVTELANVKEQLGVAHSACEVVWMKPNLLQSPLGLRKKCRPDTKYPYLVFENLMEEDPIPTTSRSSKVWSETAVVDWSKVKSCGRPDLQDKQQLKEFVPALLFRAVFDIADNAMRNFVWVERLKTVVSVDEDTVGGFKAQLSKDDADLVRRELLKHPNRYTKIIDHYTTVLSDEARQELQRDPIKLLGLNV